MIKFYRFNSEELEYEQIDLKPLLKILIPVLLFSVGFRLFFFDAAIIEKDGENLTVQEYLKKQRQEHQYDNQLKQFYKNR